MTIDDKAKGTIWHINDQRQLDYTGMHKGQVKMMQSVAQIILLLAGTQSGKTVSGPPWLLREMMTRGPGQYAVVGPSLKLLSNKALPEFRALFENAMKLGKYNKTDNKFYFNERGLKTLFGRTDEPTEVVFGYAENPETLESMTLKGLWCDEAGQNTFRLDSFWALQRRCARYRARQLYTTTPYNLGWLKTQLYDRWESGDPTFDVIRFESRMNPTFPMEEWDRMEKTMPQWKFDLMYRAIFTSPAGAIYDCFNSKYHIVDEFVIPKTWHRMVGCDFGNVNTSFVFLAQDPDSDPAKPTFYIYMTYKSGSKTEDEHIKSIKAKHPPTVYFPFPAVGGAPSENEWRDKYGNAGMPIQSPSIYGVEEGIAEIYRLLREGRLFIFRNCAKIIDEIGSYSRELDKNDEPTEKIDNKHAYHRLDALRYIGSEVAVNLAFGSNNYEPIDTWIDSDE